MPTFALLISRRSSGVAQTVTDARLAVQQRQQHAVVADVLGRVRLLVLERESDFGVVRAGDVRGRGPRVHLPVGVLPVGRSAVPPEVAGGRLLIRRIVSGHRLQEREEVLVGDGGAAPRGARGSSAASSSPPVRGRRGSTSRHTPLPATPASGRASSRRTAGPAGRTDTAR